MIDFGSTDMVPHIAERKTHQRAIFVVVHKCFEVWGDVDALPIATVADVVSDIFRSAAGPAPSAALKAKTLKRSGPNCNLLIEFVGGEPGAQLRDQFA